MTKLLFLKLYDEREVPDFYEFAVLVGQSPKELADNIRNLFSDAVMSSKYKDVFYSRFNKQPDISLELDDYTIFRLVQILQGYSLVNTTDNIHGADIKGTVFEKMVGETFRGELAQFFTPREIVDFVISFLKPSKDDVIFDPACGSGGFLIMAIQKVKERLKKEFPNLSPTELESKIKYFAEHNLLGTDINERMSRVAKMNMIMHGDGHAGIFNLNGLLTDPETPSSFVEKIKESSIIVSNPPFAGREKDPIILKKFDIGKNSKGEPRSISKELLFIENIIKLAKPHSKIGLMIPSGVFNNPSSPYVRIRDMIRKSTKIMALIALPHDAFRVSGANNEGNLLFLERTDKPPEDYEIYIDWARYVGFDATGRKLLGFNELPDILERSKNAKPQNLIKFSKLNGRIDPWYYHPRYRQLELGVSKSQYDLKSLDEVVTKSDSLFDPSEYATENLNYVETNDVDLDNGIIMSSQQLTSKTIPGRATYILKEGDFLIPNARDCVRGITIVPAQCSGWICSNRFFVVRPKTDLVNPVYLYHVLRQPAILALLKRQANGEINPGLTWSKEYNSLGKVKIPVPPLPEQDKLVKKIDENEKTKRELMRKVEEIDQSLLTSVGGALPVIETQRESLGKLGYEYIAFL